MREEAKVGQRTTLDVLNAQQELLNARVALVTAQRDRVVTSYQVLSAIGRLSAATLGLAVARKLVRSQDGDLWVEGGSHGGAAFVVSIPAAPALRVITGRAEETSVEQDLDQSIRDAR